MKPTRPRSAARTLARGWISDARRWTLASSLVLAGTLALMLGASGVLAGTQSRTLDQVADFYTGDLRLTRERQGALPTAWFYLNETGLRGAKELANDPAASPRVEAQFVASRRGLVEAAIFEQGQFPVDAPGANADATKVLALGSLVGIRDDDPSSARLASHLVAGRLPKATTDGTVEVAMSTLRLERFLTQAERDATANTDPMKVAGALSFEVTSAQVDQQSSRRDLIRRPMKVVGLYDTGVDVLDSYTMLASASQARELLGHGADEPIANAIVTWDNARAEELAHERGWSTEGAASFAKNYVGELMAVLTAVVFLVAALMFLIPTFLVSHGLARQLASQSRELAVCSAIGVPDTVLRKALLLQVLEIGALGLGVAGLVLGLASWLVPGMLAGIRWAPLPLGFALAPWLWACALAVALVALAIGWLIGFRSRSRLPISAQLRAG